MYGRFQVLFHSPPGVLFAFPSRYWFTIGRSGVFSLGGWSPHIQTGFHVSRPTRHHWNGPFVYRAITLYGRTFQSVPLKSNQLKGWSPCFSSPGSPRMTMYSSCDTSLAVGFPIRKSPDQSLFASSPKLIAGYHVLHRL
uniref:Uncharacterized protein n=1 Tax=Strongyloides venezuelensis TaxID=75913 RepID=A0A0K0FWX9_STRVS